MRHILLVIVSFFYLFIGKVATATLSDNGILCNLYYGDEKYDTAFDYCLKSAQGDLSEENSIVDKDPVVYRNLAVMYSKGLGTQEDQKEAYKWFKKAAELDDAFAISKLAYIENRKENFPEAAKWFEKSAQNGNRAAQYNIAVMYKKGLGVEQNYKKAAFYFHKASSQGHVTAMNSLGLLYMNGLGVKENYDKAKIYFKLAISKDPSFFESYYNLAHIYYNGLGVSVNYEEAFELYSRARYI